MPVTLQLPEKTRATLAELNRLHLQAQREFQLTAGVALDFLGLDPSLPHSVDYATGIVTPAQTPTPLALVDDKPDAAG